MNEPFWAEALAIPCPMCGARAGRPCFHDHDGVPQVHAFRVMHVDGTLAPATRADGEADHG